MSSGVRGHRRSHVPSTIEVKTTQLQFWTPKLDFFQPKLDFFQPKLDFFSAKTQFSSNNEVIQGEHLSGSGSVVTGASCDADNQVIGATRTQ